MTEYEKLAVQLQLLSPPHLFVLPMLYHLHLPTFHLFLGLCKHVVEITISQKLTITIFLTCLQYNKLYDNYT